MTVSPDPTPKTLADELAEALDLLDRLVDNNLETVTKQRVMAWKSMVRRELLGHDEPTTWEHAILYRKEDE